MMTYRTVSGDMWDKIAKSEMGGERYTSLLMEANPQYLDVTIFKAGVELTIPDVSRDVQKLLPPWKQVP